jgi:hypothetical protein
MVTRNSTMTIDKGQAEIDAQKSETADRSFKPSWVDRLTEWIEALPGPSWLAYLILFLILGAIAHLANYLSGIKPWFSFDIYPFLYQLWTVEILFFHEYLNQDARSALGKFRTLLGTSDDEYSKIEYEFTNLPARPVIFLTLIGAPLGIYFAQFTEIANGGVLDSSLARALGYFDFAYQVSLALILGYRIIRQLRMVSRLYGTASNIDLYNLEPVYALSSHTAKTGLIFLLIVYSNLLLSPDTLQFSVAFVMLAILTLIGTAAFFLPLRGINKRLVDEKKSMLREIQQRIKKGFGKVERSFDGDSLGEISELRTAISALEGQKTYVEKIPTWPWQPSTLRGFLTAVLLPIGIWGIQQVLYRVFNL